MYIIFSEPKRSFKETMYRSLKEALTKKLFKPGRDITQLRYEWYEWNILFSVVIMH
jgi:hypothetical protein